MLRRTFNKITLLADEQATEELISTDTDVVDPAESEPDADSMDTDQTSEENPDGVDADKPIERIDVHHLETAQVLEESKAVNSTTEILDSKPEQIP